MKTNFWLVALSPFVSAVVAFATAAAVSGDVTRFERIVLHLRCLFRDHNYRWHWTGVWRELHPVH